MSTAILDEEIANETAKLHAAETRAAEVAHRFAKAPGNAKLRAESVQAYRDISDIKATIEALQMSRPVALDLDRQAIEEARMAAIPKALEKTRALLAERVAAGKAVDDALAALHEAVRAWVALSRETTAAAVATFRLVDPGVKVAPDLQIGNEAVSRIAYQVDAATHGLDSRGTMDFNLQGMGVPETVAEAAEKKAARVAQHLEYYVQRAAH